MIAILILKLLLSTRQIFLMIKELVISTIHYYDKTGKTGKIQQTDSQCLLTPMNINIRPITSNFIDTNLVLYSKKNK